MEIEVNQFRYYTRLLLECVESTHGTPTTEFQILHIFLENEFSTAKDIQLILEFLSTKLIDPTWTETVAIIFEKYILLLVTMGITNEQVPDYMISQLDLVKYQSKCVALAKLMHISKDVKRYAPQYFLNKPAPFQRLHNSLSTVSPAKKLRKTNEITDTTMPLKSLTLIKCFYQLLSADPVFFKDCWNWTELISDYFTETPKSQDLQQLYINNIVAIITDMTSTQIKELNKHIPASIHLEFEKEQVLQYHPLVIASKPVTLPENYITLNVVSDHVTSVEGVLLPIFNKRNFKFYTQTDGVYDKIVKVDSTKVNLRSIALGISSAKAVCLSGPVGCGKTTLLEYLARKTGRIKPNHNELELEMEQIQSLREENGKENCFIDDNQLKVAAGKKKKPSPDAVEEIEALLQQQQSKKASQANGFLRIQLGDQTDSKMLLGQYRCTDVPGEFVWLPGVLTQAVMHGYWLLLEDLNAATPDTFTILSSLLENGFLSVPGFRDCVKIEPGFQLFVTVRTNKSSSVNTAQKSLFALLEKHLYTINILPLSRNELCKVVSSNYPKLATIANRIVDVFLTFSSGDHTSADNLRQQESAAGDKADTTDQYLALPFEQITPPPTTTNSGRLVSTRDLVKLCQRSNPMFSVTSAECAYFVFQNAVDVFCSYLPHSQQKTKLICSIGAKLGIIQSRCEFFANDYKPEVTMDQERIKVGRAELLAKSLRKMSAKEVEMHDDSNNQSVKRMKLSENTERGIAPQTVISKKSSATFSFTRLASCILERVAVCVAHEEPVLLVGETGVGKTSAVQYLAERTHHKLVVVNMNNQSDVSDLIGGFKPVDLTYVVAPLRNEFELLFRCTYNQEKNESFLNKFAICYNQGNYPVIITLMQKITSAVFDKNSRNELRRQQLEYLPRWQTLRLKLSKLSAQLAKSINISFAFIPGSLVNCIKNGDWVLLDEINLASAETLECLSTILEPDGSVVLLEKGDFTPVKRHPNFRIFACMNPNTDIGKKDLSVGIRNRFTEFFVDELTTESDLTLLISDYLASTGIQRKSVSNIVKLYKNLTALSKLELNDGLGNRPVFSLRTLCRALRICAKNLCGSIERNLYESFCMSFLTQLDSASHQWVLQLIKGSLLSNAKAVLMQGIPKPAGKFLNFEGYWIEQGPNEVQECEHYILTESVRDNLKDLARIVSIGKLPILLQGPTSAGKTSLIEYVAKRSGNQCLRINNHEHTDLQEYIGTYAADLTGKLSFREGVLVQAMRNGYWIILDELNLASSDILEALNRVLDDNRELFIAETQEVVRAHPNFMLFATQNPPGLYGGRKTLSRAFKNRFIELHFSEIPRHELELILEQRCHIPPSYAKKMVLCMAELQKNRKTTTAKNVFTLRDLFRWGNRYTYADEKLLADSNYDWNQHLIEEGYLVLSAKVRTAVEIEIIEETLYRNFKKRIHLERLFDAHSEQSPSAVTRDILASLKAYNDRTDIVWTIPMTRMAVLTAKAIQFNEPVLLVGPTGCGKTTVCQVLASLRGVTLRILNCHMHTEGADFLGGLRPCRQQKDDGTKQLFEWADGPLIYAMQEGSYFMADEISLAEDSVLERLNCILEPERTVLLAEKGGVAGDAIDDIDKQFVVKAKQGFQFLATMNPGGDFGKKELSPALRNRFTEIWCHPSDTRKDLIQIAHNCLLRNGSVCTEEPLQVATYIVDVVLFMREHVDKFKYSVRDILAWAQYMLNNHMLSFPARAIFGLETVFLDALEMLPHESLAKVELLKMKIIEYAIAQASVLVGVTFTLPELLRMRGSEITMTNGEFGIEPFFIATNTSIYDDKTDDNFLFDAPTTKKNLFRLLSALSLNKAVLLEGPPGVGKTSIVESIAHAIGYEIVRINLCEHTDLADLFGTDLPAENSCADNVPKLETAQGSFVWRDGPLLAALKSPNTWILLDELNLAPQSVLEGLNAILDHRGEVYIPELNKSFQLSQRARIFACQNPLKQGGGRKGLPQSFLNRFNKVYLRKLSTEDLLFVVKAKYSQHFEKIRVNFCNRLRLVTALPRERNLFKLHQKLVKTASRKRYPRRINCREFQLDLAERLVKFSERLDVGIANMEFGYKGGPFEINLRDILRWCESLKHPETGYILNGKNIKALLLRKNSVELFKHQFNIFLLTLYERMKLVYYQRMRSPQDKLFIRNAFSTIFNCNADLLNDLSEDVALYWTDDKVYLNDIVMKRSTLNEAGALRPLQTKSEAPLLLTSQRELLKNLVECVHMEKPVLLCGPTDAGKTKIINTLCTLSNQLCNTDSIDDSVTGSFQQIDLNRHLENISKTIQSCLTRFVQSSILHASFCPSHIKMLLNLWYDYKRLTKSAPDFAVLSDELNIFRKRIELLNVVSKKLYASLPPGQTSSLNIGRQKRLLSELQNRTRSADSLNTGGSFEWVDSKIVHSLKHGEYINLEHVNLCSSAVLDRLNPVFEPDGRLMISEKGVTAADEAEIVYKATNFRAFLTLDPKNGELSRAMRNRCIELALTKDAVIYDTDDMRAIVHSCGVTDVVAINCLLRIHERITQLTDINQYTISHLTHFSGLTASYKRIGYTLDRAIYVAGMEVYVYSANMDLLGYGLAYYQNKLREIVVEEMKTVANMQLNAKEDHLMNVILNCGDLTTSSLVRLQIEPLRIMLSQKEKDIQVMQRALAQVFTAFESYKFNTAIGVDEILTYYIFLLYETSTKDDLKLRYTYIKDLLSAHPHQQKMQQLSQKLFSTLQNVHKQFDCVILSALPWNIHLFPRLRDYARNPTNILMRKAYCLSLELLLNVNIPDVPYATCHMVNMRDIDALSYSQAVTAKVIPNKLKNAFLQYLGVFLKRLRDILLLMLESSKIDLKIYAEIITRLFWFKRLLASSQQKLFIANEFNTNMMDKLLLHFKWLHKYMLQFFMDLLPYFSKLNEEFTSTLEKLTAYASSVKPPLNVVRKIYAKRLVDFQPFYKEEQISLLSLYETLDSHLALIPFYGNFTPDVVIKKFIAQKSDAASRCRAQLAKQYLNSKYNFIFKEVDVLSTEGEDLPAQLREIVVQFVSSNREINALTSSLLNENSPLNVDSFSADLESIKQFINAEDEISAELRPNELQLGLLTLREYFLVKYMAVMLTRTTPEISRRHFDFLNESYFECISSLSSDTRHLLRVLKTPKYHNFSMLWSALSKHLETVDSVDEFHLLLRYLKGNYSSVNTFKRLIGNASIQLQLNSLANQVGSVSNILHSSCDITASSSYTGPSLIQSLRALLYTSEGTPKAVPLNELSLWKQSLNEMRQLLWLNSNFVSENFNTVAQNFNAVRLHTKILLIEVDYVDQLFAVAEHKILNDDTNDYNNAYNKNFMKLVDELRNYVSEVDDIVNRNHSSRKYQLEMYKMSLLNSVIGAIEVCLLSFTPEIDPVEKNRLKSAYVLEDINCLTTLTTVYDFMRIVMKYKHFGADLYNAFAGRLQILAAKQHKYSQRVALRPEHCRYNSLVQDIRHFLVTNCEPQALLQLIQQVHLAWSCIGGYGQDNEAPSLDNCTEVISKIELWIANSQRFLHHTLQGYTNYYQDFIQPLQCSVNQLRFGFEGFKSIMTQLRNSFEMSSHEITPKGLVITFDISANVHRLLANIIEFPAVHALKIYNSKSTFDIHENRSVIFNILNKINDGKSDIFRLIKVKITDLHNKMSISGDIEDDFRDFDFAFNVCNQIWQKEEEDRRQRKEEAESLYVTKTKCATEDEDLLEMQEIEEMFPTSVQEDFGEFVQEDTLEKILKLHDKQKNTSATHVTPVIRDDDYSFLVENFIAVLEKYSRVDYYNSDAAKRNTDHHQLDIMEPFKERMSVFIRIFEQYKSCCNEWIDEQAFNSFSFAVGLQQQMLNELSFPVKRTTPYNFYKDSNIPEIISCTNLLQRIDSRVHIQLTLYPEHAGLSDIIRVIERIRSLPATAPVVRFNTGFQILRQKISLWNEMAHKNNHLRDEEIEVAEYVQRWTKLELQFWRGCLAQTYKQVEVQAYRYWFFLYNLLQQYMVGHSIGRSLTNMKYAEQRFVCEDAFDDVEVETKFKVEALDVIRILRQFVESSKYGDFHVRLRLLRSFELYLHITDQDSNIKQSKSIKSILIAGIHNLQVYFNQFSQEIEDVKKNIRKPIEKKLKEFVKIESYNKDLSYFSMRNNVAKVHRQLNKFLKEYRLQLQQTITPIFQPKDATVRDYNVENDRGKDLRNESKIKYHMIDVKAFIAPQNMVEKFSTDKLTNLLEIPEKLGASPSLLQKVDKHFFTARNVVKEIVANAPYPKLIIALDDFFCQQLERCDQLRKLEVDRSKERTQQKIEAKQILQQKRKALSDLFKSLVRLGVSYRSGLMKLSLDDELNDYTLPPFCIMTMMNTPKDKRIFMKLNENLEKYFAKSVFKLQLLQNIMLAPLAELGLPNIERIKGNAVDLFLLVQSQRHFLATSTKNLYDLRQLLQNLKQIADIVASTGSSAKEDVTAHIEFEKSHQSGLKLKKSLCHIRYVFEQFILLLSCVAKQHDDVHSVLSEEASAIFPSLHQGSEHFTSISQHSDHILNATKSTLSDMSKSDSFISLNKVNSYKGAHEKIVNEITSLVDCCRDSAGGCLPICRPLTQLLNSINGEDEDEDKEDEVETQTSGNDAWLLENIDTELENIVHCVLLSMQKLYKKYRKGDDNDEPKTESPKCSEGDNDEQIQERHLKRQLLHEMLCDWEVLDLPSVITKLSNLVLALKYAPALPDKLPKLLKAISAIPVLEQFQLIAEYYLCQQLSAHKVAAKMLSVMLTVFVEISTKGFCVPADLMQDDEEGQSKKEQKEGEGFGLEDGTGEKDASDKLESEDQLDDAKRPEDRKDDDNKNDEDCKEEKGIEMSEDFDGKMQDIEKPEEDDSASSEEDEEDIDKEMGETEEGADKLDDQIWGDDEDPQPEEDDEEQKMQEEEEGKGSKDEKDSHNDLDSKNDAAKEGKDEHDKDGLDATNEPNNDKKKQQEKEDIDNMKDPEIGEEQENPYHNELEEPPEAEEMDLGHMNNVDDEHEEGNEEEQADDNPFDIDAMKENMETAEDNNDKDEGERDEKDDEKEGESEVGDDESDSDEGEAGTEVKEDKNTPPEELNSEEGDEAEPETQKRAEMEEEDDKEMEQQPPEAEERPEKPEEYQESKDKPSKEENVQSVQESKSNASADQVNNDDEKQEDVRQEQKMDEQETGEEKDGVGQAETDTNEGGHQGIADTKETISQQEEHQKKRQTEEKRKQGRTDEERTLGEAEKNKLKQLKTIDKLKDRTKDDTENQPDEKEVESEEYQHVKEPKTSDKTTLDNATEEQTKQIQHLDDEEMSKDDENEAGNDDEIMDTKEDEDQAIEDANMNEISAEKFDQKSEKASKSEKTNERAEAQEEKMEVEGETVATATVLRNDDTTAHCINEILLDNSSAGQDLSIAESLELRKMYHQQLTAANRNGPPQHEDYETWQTISNRMVQNARELCEQLRLILEPTKCTRLKGDYRTGRRINMKKIIPYIASQFRKDKIWLRRTKPAQRDYKITIAIDDSKSMHHNNSKTLTLEAISLVAQALTLLESGRLSIVSFGEMPQIVLHHTEQLDGPKLVKALSFAQDKTKIAQLLDFVRTVNTEEGGLGSDNGIFENLLLVLSDGRNIFSEGKTKVKNAIKLARLQRMFLVYIIIDNPENKNSILDIQTMEVLPDNKINIKSYLDDFPFPYYVIVRDLNQLPLVLSEAMRQWFELVNSEQ